MYKRYSQSWLKHIDFIILDIISLQGAYLIAFAIRQGGVPYAVPLYRMLGIILALVEVLFIVLFSTMKGVLFRGYGIELKQTLKQASGVFAGITAYMFIVQIGDAYSRIVVSLTAGFYFLLSYIIRILWKRVIRDHALHNQAKPTMIVVADPQDAEETIQNLTKQAYLPYKLCGIVLTENIQNEHDVQGVPILCTFDEAATYICREWIDSVFVNVNELNDDIHIFLERCHEMAIPTHVCMPQVLSVGSNLDAESIGDYLVLTSSIKLASPGHLFLKRCMDIVGGLIGSVITLFILLVIGPMIYRKSPGPIFFKQERIGKNGRRFKMYKIRSMSLDADQKKAALMAQNRVQDGMMFKLDFDPRIIGNEILPDGSRKTGIGEFIRKTSLDEFPQFFNVLRGEMSLVGTRPPTVDEWEKYQFHHRARLACKPGITGMWQVNGRSEITDFEKVVKLDTEYITNWSLKLDFQILLKTVVMVFNGKGAM